MKSIYSILRPRCENIRNINLLTSNIRLMHTADEKIEIPKRIPRGPTDILRALESTIKVDPTAPHYKYNDDPYLVPMSNIGKRTYAMAQESGKKAAHWVRAQHPELFQHKEADPPVKAFYSKVIYDENGEISEADLKHAIDEVLISDSIQVYKLCKEKGVEISSETLTSLLEFLCFYNSDDTISEEFIEERWFRQSNKGKDRQRKIWKDGDIAEEIFISIDKPDNVAYSAIIQGMSKYFQVDRAHQLFQEAQEKELILCIEAYNSLIKVSNFIKESFEMRWQFVTEILNLIEKAKIKPNLGTLNATLETLSFMGSSKNTKELVLRTLSQFKKIGVEPALSSWYYVLITYCKERGPVSTILEDIMIELENKEFQIQDVKDTFFFVTAMDVCRNHLHDRDLAKRVHKLLHFGNNYDLIGDSFKESIYYRHYFILLCETEPLNIFMEEFYYKFVPHIYVPEPAVMLEILNTIDMNASPEYLPKLWSDIIIFDHINRENILELVGTIMINHQPEEDKELTENFAKIAWDIFTKIEQQNENRVRQLTFTGPLLGNLLTVLLKNGDFEKGTIIMEKLHRDHQKIVGVPNIEALKLYLEECIKELAPSKAILCIQYTSESGFQEAEEMAAKLNSSLTLHENHLEKLSTILGSLFIDHSLKKAEEVTSS